uniref:Uncharacterized protein n=1 Tax=Anguilla anguilla TaxID=7936 RepID=A0A0E9TKM8_ANGAN
MRSGAIIEERECTQEQFRFSHRFINK